MGSRWRIAACALCMGLAPLGVPLAPPVRVANDSCFAGVSEGRVARPLGRGAGTVSDTSQEHWQSQWHTAEALAVPVTRVALAEPTAPRELVVPIQWSRFERAAPSDDLRQSGRLLLGAARYNLGWIEAAFRLDPATESYPLHRMNEHGVRPAASVVYTLGVVLSTGLYDAEAAGLPREEALRRTARLLRGVAGSHKANRSGESWGDGWQSALWAALAGQGAWMLWTDLDEKTQEATLRMVLHEAGRFLDYEVPYWNGRGGDTKGEENSWNSMILNLAVAMMPDHPDSRRWKEKSSELMVSSYATESDFRENETLVDGRPVRRWLRGYNAMPGGVVVNHDRIHPDYMVAQTMNLWAYTTQSLAGRPVPEAGEFGGARIYRTLVTRAWPSPPHRPPGGTIYVRGRVEVYYPEGTDWSTHDLTLYYLEDVWAKVLGWDRDLPRRAVEWMRPRAAAIGAMQARHADRRMFAPGEYDTYPGAEQLAAWCLADAYLALWLWDHAALSPTANWLVLGCGSAGEPVLGSDLDSGRGQSGSGLPHFPCGWLSLR